jgi:hypothetical protein
MPTAYPSEISIVKTTDMASANSPVGRTDGVFTYVPPSLPTEKEDDLFTFDSGDVHGAIIQIKEVSGLKIEVDKSQQAAEDSKGLWQINVEPAHTDNPDTFDWSGLMQWANGTTVGTETITIAHEGFWLI